MIMFIILYNCRMNNKWCWEVKCLGDDFVKYDFDNRIFNKVVIVCELCVGCFVKCECVIDVL